MQAGNLRGVRLDYDGKSALPGFSPSQAFGIGIDDPSGKDMSWIGDFSDELSVAIATRTFEEAVEFVEKGLSRSRALLLLPLTKLLRRQGCSPPTRSGPSRLVPLPRQARPTHLRTRRRPPARPLGPLDSKIWRRTHDGVASSTRAGRTRSRDVPRWTRDARAEEDEADQV